VTVTFDQPLLQRIADYNRTLREEIAEREAAQRALAARALACAAHAVNPDAHTVTVHEIDSWFAFTDVTCTGPDGSLRAVEALPVEVLSVVSAALATLCPGEECAPWRRAQSTAELDVAAALVPAAGYPFQTVEERVLGALEEQTGKTIRKVEITSEEFENGFYPSTTVEVDFTDDDSDYVYFEAFADGDFLSELHEYQGQFGRNTRIVITRSAQGITID